MGWFWERPLPARSEDVKEFSCSHESEYQPRLCVPNMFDRYRLNVF